MSQSTEVYLYTSRELPSPMAVGACALAAIGCSEVYTAHHAREDGEWERYRYEVLGAPGAFSPPPWSRNLVAAHVPPREALVPPERGWCLTIKPQTDTFSRPLYDAIVRDVPEDLRERCVPSEPTLRIGPHDIYDCVEDEDGTYYGCATFSLSLWTYGVPLDTPRFKEMLERVPEVKELKSRLEDCAGPLRFAYVLDV